jgi:3-isopropylmalate/(R)-2-methylmalate dehydratase small subunit
MIFEGAIHVFGDHIDTDVIIPAKYLNQSDPAQLALRCFEPIADNFHARVKARDILVAGENFGCGSSREHAPIAIKATGVACVVARSFARIFYRSAINIGLPVVVCPPAVEMARDGERARVDIERGLVEIAGERFNVAPYPAEVLGIIACGGLVPFMRRRLQAQAMEASV